jgi:hypothetical protein
MPWERQINPGNNRCLKKGKIGKEYTLRETYVQPTAKYMHAAVRE